LNKNEKISLALAIGVASVAYLYLKKNETQKIEIEDHVDTNVRKKIKLFRTKKTSKISRSLLKVLNDLDNNRLLFIVIDTKGKKARNALLEQLETLKSETPLDEMWIADFYKQKFSLDSIVIIANKKALFYLSNLQEVEKISLSTRKTLAKIIGNSLSVLSTKYPSMEKYFFEPMLDIYAPLKETEEIGNFGIVQENILYRGSMPVGEHNYEQLAQLGIKTVVNLKIEDSAVEYVTEQNNLQKREINLHYMPLPNVAAPTILQGLEFLTLVYGSETKPVFVHCHRGADRTGIMSALFRITQGYTASWSLLEAEKYNIASSFHNHKIEYVYNFEKKWNIWKEEGKIPSNLNNFDFTKLMEEDEIETTEVNDLKTESGDGEN
jgi:protein tyrosine/serine phosphatase